jgi:hypothetical protein
MSESKATDFAKYQRTWSKFLGLSIAQDLHNMFWSPVSISAHMRDFVVWLWVCVHEVFLFFVQFGEKMKMSALRKNDPLWT